MDELILCDCGEDCHAATASLRTRLSATEAERDYWRKAAGTKMCGPECAHCLYQNERARADAAEARVRELEATSAEYIARTDPHIERLADQLEAAAAEAASLRRSLEEARGLLARWWRWAEGIAFTAPREDQRLVADTIDMVATPSPEGKPEAMPVEIVCTACQRTFPTLDAAYGHCMKKHGLGATPGPTREGT